MKTNNTQLEGKKLTKKDLNKVYWRWLLHGETGWNYEKMQGLCYAYSMLPALRKIYTDDDELNEAVKSHLQFFNTNPYTVHFILGANLAIEEEKGIEAKDTIASIKTGLMGPMAGVGDTLFGVIMGTVFGSIAAYMALEGNPMGVYLWIVANVIKLVISRGFLTMGYQQGVKLVDNIGGTLKNLTEAANILGLTVVGALVPTVIRANVPYVFAQGDVTMELQGILDQFMPALIPVCLVGFVYWLLGQKKMNSTKAILVIMVISILAFACGILA